MQEIELEPFDVVGDHSQMVKAPTISKGYGSKDCVNLPLSTAVSRIKFQRINRRYVMLLEVLIAFVLIVFCALPLIYPHVFILRSEKQFVATVELDHFVNLLFVDTLEQLYLNEIPWGAIEGEKSQPIDDAILRRLGYDHTFPFNGVYYFQKKKYKKSSEDNHAAYLLNLIFKFTPKQGVFVSKPVKEPTYTYNIAVEVK